MGLLGVCGGHHYPVCHERCCRQQTDATQIGFGLGCHYYRGETKLIPGLTPWGTPDVMSPQDEWIPFTVTE